VVGKSHVRHFRDALRTLQIMTEPSPATTLSIIPPDRRVDRGLAILIILEGLLFGRSADQIGGRDRTLLRYPYFSLGPVAERLK